MPNILTKIAISSAVALLPVISCSAATLNSDSKTIDIYNNFSNKPIYVQISSTPNKGTEQFFSFSASANNPQFTETVAPHSHKLISVPPAHWNAGRVYIFDSNPTTNNTKSPTWEAYHSIGGPYQLVEFTFTKPNVDYDFSAVDSLYSTLPLAVEVSDGSVGYTGVKMATAVIDKNSQSGSFTKASIDLIKAFNTSFLTKIATFPESLEDSASTGSSSTSLGLWPIFIKQNQFVANIHGGVKVPGGYNALALPSAGVLSTDITTSLTNRWTYWVYGSPCASGDKFCAAFQNDLKSVWQAFTKNATNNHINPSANKLVKHILGFVPFGDGTNWSGITTGVTDHLIADKVIGLEKGVPFELADKDKSREYPDYNSPFNLNPYVAFIHKKLGLNIYAFSIDDGTGNINVAGKGITIDVGALNGIKNKNQYVNPSASPYHLNLPGSVPNVPNSRLGFGSGWSTATICGSQPKVINGKPNSFPIIFKPGSSTCAITLKSIPVKNGSSKSMTMSIEKNTTNGTLSLPSRGSSGSCTASPTDFSTNCDGIQINNKENPLNGTVAISPITPDTPKPPAPTPAPTPTNLSFHIYFGSGWSTAEICDGKQQTIGGKAMALPIIFKQGSSTCNITLDDKESSKTIMTIGMTDGKLSKSSCSGIYCGQIIVNENTWKDINTPAI